MRRGGCEIGHRFSGACDLIFAGNMAANPRPSTPCFHDGSPIRLAPRAGRASFDNMRGDIDAAGVIAWLPRMLDMSSRSPEHRASDSRPSMRTVVSDGRILGGRRQQRRQYRYPGEYRYRRRWERHRQLRHALLNAASTGLLQLLQREFWTTLGHLGCSSVADLSSRVLASSGDPMRWSISASGNVSGGGSSPRLRWHLNLHFATGLCLGFGIPSRSFVCTRRRP